MMVQHPPGEDVLEMVLIGSQKYQASALSSTFTKRVTLAKSLTSSFVKMQIMLTLQRCLKVQMRQYRQKILAYGEDGNMYEFPMFFLGSVCS